MVVVNSICKRGNMAASKAQRVGIFIIAFVMVVGTIGSFFIIIVANQNAQKDQQDQQAAYSQQMEAIQKQQEEYEKEQQKIAAELSPTYYPLFKEYASAPATFDDSKVTKLETKDIKVGDGKEVATPADYRAYYIGWTANGKVFDQSIDGDSLKAPFDPSMGTIDGWTQGTVGMKIGGVRQITIPGALAYGENPPSADIAKNAPLKFIVMAIPPASANEG